MYLLNDLFRDTKRKQQGRGEASDNLYWLVFKLHHFRFMAMHNDASWRYFIFISFKHPQQWKARTRAPLHNDEKLFPLFRLFLCTNAKNFTIKIPRRGKKIGRAFSLFNHFNDLKLLLCKMGKKTGSNSCRW